MLYTACSILLATYFCTGSSAVAEKHTNIIFKECIVYRTCSNVICLYVSGSYVSWPGIKHFIYIMTLLYYNLMSFASMSLCLVYSACSNEGVKPIYNISQETVSNNEDPVKKR